MRISFQSSVLRKLRARLGERLQAGDGRRADGASGDIDRLTGWRVPALPDSVRIAPGPARGGLIHFRAVADLQQAALPESPVELPLVSLRRERRRWVQKLTHVLPAVMLLGAGVSRLRAGEQGFGLALAVAELAVSALLLRTLAKEIAAAQKAHAHPHQGVDWFEIFAAGVLALEALEHWHTTGHLPRPTVLTALLTLGLGLFHRQFADFVGPRRALRIDHEGIRVRSRFRRQLFAPWSDVERIDLDESKARIVARGGRERSFDLTDLRNAAEVRQALFEAQGRLAR